MMADYNWVDYVLLAIFFIVTMSGIVRGGAKEIISILSWVVAYIVAGMFASQVAGYFTTPGESTTNNFALWASFCGLFFITLLVGSLIGSLVGNALDSVGLGLLNRLVGAVAGFAKGYLINVVIIFLVQLIFPNFAQQEAWTQSKVVADLQPAVQWFSNLVKPGLESVEAKIGQTLQNSQGGSNLMQMFHGSGN